MKPGKIPDIYSKDFKDLVFRCMDKQPDRRPTTEEIIDELNLILISDCEKLYRGK